MQLVKTAYALYRLPAVARAALDIVAERGVQLVFIAEMIRHRAGENGVVGKGEAVDRVVDERAEREPLPRGGHPAFCEPAHELVPVAEGIVRVMPVHELMPEEPARIRERVYVRLDTAEEEQQPPRPADIDILLVEQQPPYLQMVFLFQNDAFFCSFICDAVIRLLPRYVKWNL